MSTIFEAYSQEISFPAKINPLPAYSFLSRPPPQKKRPIKPLPSPPAAYASQLKPTAPLELRTVKRRASNTFSSICNWAAHVQPGSPASLSPRSPASSIRRRLSNATLGSRRPSIGHGRAARSVSGTLVNLDNSTTPMTAATPSFTMKECKAGLAAVGYTSVFFGFPKTPISAAAPIPIKLGSPTDWVHVDGPKTAHVGDAERKPKGAHRRLRSLGAAFSSRSRSRSDAPPLPARADSKKEKKTGKSGADAITKQKKPKYTPTRPRPRPAPLGNELALMQFMDGGNADATVRRFMESYSAASLGGGAGVGDAFRDGKGGVWWDEDEELEYRHLLAPSSASAEETLHDVPLTPPSGASEVARLGSAQWVKLVTAVAETRTIASSRGSDLDERSLVRAEPGALDGAHGFAAIDSASILPYLQADASSSSSSILALPARPRRTAPHLCKANLLVDAAFRPPATPRTPKAPKSPKSPKSPKQGSSPRARRRPSLSAFSASVGNTTACKPGKAKAGRRPAPLTIVPPAPPGRAIALAVNVLTHESGLHGETDAQKGKREFDATAFRPRVARPARGAGVRRPVGMVGLGEAEGLRDVEASTRDSNEKEKLKGTARADVRGLFRVK